MSNTILIFNLFIVIGIGISFTELLLRSKKEKWKPFYKIIYFISSIVIAGIAFALLSYFASINKSKSKLKTRRDLEISDSLYKLGQEEKKALESQIQREEDYNKTVKYIQSYYDAYCINNLTRLDSFYIYPMQHYYTYPNATKDIVHERATFEYLCRGKKRFENGCKINPNKIRINKISKDTTEVSIEQSKRKEGQVYTNIMLNKENQIFSIINIIQKPFEDSTDVKFDLLKKKTNK